MINGVLRPTLNPKEFHFSAHKRGDLPLVMATCSTLDRWCEIVCEAAIDLIRSDRGA
ncbi:MAG: hypothetical protein K8T20_09670 [Planctomycetes bacterium]|nr:hypothetical protein [Planctomycetota bacterium]